MSRRLHRDLFVKADAMPHVSLIVASLTPYASTDFAMNRIDRQVICRQSRWVQARQDKHLPRFHAWHDRCHVSPAIADGDANECRHFGKWQPRFATTDASESHDRMRRTSFRGRLRTSICNNRIGSTTGVACSVRRRGVCAARLIMSVPIRRRFVAISDDPVHRQEPPADAYDNLFRRACPLPPRTRNSGHTSAGNRVFST